MPNILNKTLYNIMLPSIVKMERMDFPLNVYSAITLLYMCTVWSVLSPRTVTHLWQCTTPTGLSAM